MKKYICIGKYVYHTKVGDVTTFYIKREDIEDNINVLVIEDWGFAFHGTSNREMEIFVYKDSEDFKSLNTEEKIIKDYFRTNSKWLESHCW